MNRLKRFLNGKTFSVRNGRFDLNHPMIENVRETYCERLYNTYCSNCDRDICFSCKYKTECKSCKFNLSCEQYTKSQRVSLVSFSLDKNKKLVARYEIGAPTPSFFTWDANRKLYYDCNVSIQSSIQSSLKERLADYHVLRILDTSL